jgi:MATE family multidrug resistance protein
MTEYIKENWKLSLPIILGQIGQIGTNIADNIMVGNSGSDQLAAASLSNAIFIFLFVLGVGFSMASTPLIAELKADNNTKRIGVISKNSFYINLILGSIIGGITFCASYLLPYINQPENVVEYAIPYLQILAISTFPVMVFLSFKQFLEGLENTKIAMRITLISNAINILLNWVLIYGKFGFEPMGLYGAGIATLISRVFMALAMMIVFFRAKFLESYKDLWLNSYYSSEAITKLRKLGLPIGLQFSFEVSAFAGAGILSGWIGENALAAHQVALNLASISWAIATGFGAAVTIQTSKFIGLKQYDKLEKIYGAGFLMTTAWMLVTGIIFLIFSTELASLYLKDTSIINLAASLLFVAFLFQVSDGAQVVGLSALRGFQDVKIPTWLTLIAYWVFGIPSGYILAFWFDMGVHGVWYGLFIGLSLSALLLFLRLNHQRKKIQVS